MQEGIIRSFTIKEEAGYFIAECREIPAIAAFNRNRGLLKRAALNKVKKHDPGLVWFEIENAYVRKARFAFAGFEPDHIKGELARIYATTGV